MGSRLALHDLLKSLCGPNVYYQAPSTGVMNYPAVLYSINNIDNSHADNIIYRQGVGYSITIMSKDADCVLVDKISKLPKCRFDRRFISDGIYHTNFNIYY